MYPLGLTEPKGLAVREWGGVVVVFLITWVSFPPTSWIAVVFLCALPSVSEAGLPSQSPSIPVSQFSTPIQNKELAWLDDEGGRSSDSLSESVQTRFRADRRLLSGEVSGVCEWSRLDELLDD